MQKYFSFVENQSRNAFAISLDLGLT